MTPQEKYQRVGESVDLMRDSLAKIDLMGKKIHRIFKYRFTNATSLFLFSALNRTLNLSDALIDAVSKWNFIVATSLLRGVIETLAALVYVHSSDANAPEVVAGFFVEGRLPFPKRKDVRIKRVPIKDQIELAEKEFPGISNVYNELCEIAHFGSKNFFAMYRSIDADEKKLTLGIEVGNENWPEREILELLGSCATFCEGIAKYSEVIARRFSSGSSSFGPVVID